MEELTPERGVSDDCEVKTNDFYTNVEVERNGQGFRLLPSDARQSECSVGFQIYSWYAELAKHLNQMVGDVIQLLFGGLLNGARTGNCLMKCPPHWL